MLHKRLDALGLALGAIEPLFAPTMPCCHRGLIEPIARPEAFAEVILDFIADLAGRLGEGAHRLECNTIA